MAGCLAPSWRTDSQAHSDGLAFADMLGAPVIVHTKAQVTSDAALLADPSDKKNCRRRRKRAVEKLHTAATAAGVDVIDRSQDTDDICFWHPLGRKGLFAARI